MKKLLLTMVILLGVSFGYAQQYRANGTGWTLRLFSNGEENEEEMGIGLFEDQRQQWEEQMEEEMDIDMDFFYSIRGLEGGGLFGRGEKPTGVGSGYRNGVTPLFGLPGFHGNTEDLDAPLGSGALLLVGFGAAYLMAKKRKDEE